MHNLKYNKTVTSPSQIYKMAIRSPKAGKIIIDDVFLSNDEQYASVRPLECEEPDNGSLYTLDGRRMEGNSVRPGIYVRNKKKIVVPRK